VLHLTDGPIGREMTDPGEEPPEWWIRNATPRPIWLEHEGHVFTLAPLEERKWRASPKHCGGRLQPEDPCEMFPELSRLVDRHQLEIRRHRSELPRDQHLARAVRLTLIVGFAWLASLWPLSFWWWQRIGGVLAIGAGLCFLVLLTRPSRRQAGRQVGRWTGYNVTMAAVLAVGVFVPATALYLATDLSRAISIWPNGFRIDASQPLVLIGRLMQLTFIAVATLLPALMYFQFDAERLGTLRDRWIQNVFRLDPTVSTTCDVYAKYGKQLEEAYGGCGDSRGRLTKGRRSPVVLTTFVLAFGWLLILLKGGDKINAGSVDDSGFSFIALLNPDHSMVAFAFLGTYFFALQLVWQAYVRADLRPKTYTTITVRVLIVTILAWLIAALTKANQHPEPLYVLAFAAGFVPDRVLHLLWEKCLPRLGNILNQDRQQQLTELEGIDLYERTRLWEEGITSVEALAHHDLLDLFFKTRVPAPRLVDWVDQAILVMYLSSDATGRERGASAAGGGNTAGESGNGGANRVKPTVPNGPVLRSALRALGVRTASDLVGLTRRGDKTDKRESGGDLERLASAVEKLLPPDESERRDVRQRLCLLSSMLDHSEWLARIENWRRSDLIEKDAAHRMYIDERGDLRRGDPRHSVADPMRASSGEALTTRAA
jgi:hypothetical protein